MQSQSDIAQRGRYLWQQDGSPKGREAEYRELARLLAEYERVTPPRPANDENLEAKAAK